MTDQQATSPVNLFSSPASSLTAAGSALDALGMNPAQSGAFSKELSHASQRAALSNEPSRWRQDASRDSEPRSSNRALESSRRPNSAEASQHSDRHSGASVDDTSKSAGSTDSAERRTSDTESRSNPATPNEARSDADTSDGSTASSDASDKQPEANPASNAGSSELDTRSLEKIQSMELNSAINSPLQVEENADGIVSTEDGKGSISDDKQLITDISAQVENEEPLSAGDSEKLSSDIPQSSITAAAVNGARPAADSVGSPTHETDNELEGIRNAGRASVHQLTMGEQLSPTELASRQGALVNLSGNRDRQSVGTLTSTIDSDQAAPEMLLSRPSAIVNTRVPVPGVQARPVTVDPTLTLDATATESHLDSQGLPPIENDGLLNARQAVQSDMRIQANAQKELIAQKIEQESTAASLMQSKQLAQQQVQSVVLAPASADNVSQTSDNMFHSLPGGIVTAPILQRADAGNTQTINAPVNMPILQNDAEKAMTSNIRWMVSGGIKSAVVNVTPSGMGPISVSIGVENEQMNVSIVALQGSTREALDSMLPRLREQLSAQGHDSVKVDISDGRPEQSDRGYGQQFSGEQKDTESSSTDSYSDAGGIGNKASDDEQSASLPENSALTLRNNGQIKSSYDVYV